MKKVTKLSGLILGIGLTWLAYSQYKRAQKDQNEAAILHRLQRKYNNHPIKGSWIQKQGNCYLGEITVFINHQWRNLHFQTNSNGQLISHD